MMAKIPSFILSQYLRCNGSIQVDSGSDYFLKFSGKNTNYVSQDFSYNEYIKQWYNFRRECNLHESSYFQWLQSLYYISKRWKFIIKENATNLSIHEHNFFKGSRDVTLDKLASTEKKFVLISKDENKPSSNFH